MVQHIYCNYKSTAKAVFFFTEQRFEETAKQDNPHLLRVGALKIYCERKPTAISSLFFVKGLLQLCIDCEGSLFFAEQRFAV